MNKGKILKGAGTIGAICVNPMW